MLSVVITILDSGGLNTILPRSAMMFFLGIFDLWQLNKLLLVVLCCTLSILDSFWTAILLHDIRLHVLYEVFVIWKGKDIQQ